MEDEKKTRNAEEKKAEEKDVKPCFKANYCPRYAGVRASL